MLLFFLIELICLFFLCCFLKISFLNKTNLSSFKKTLLDLRQEFSNIKKETQVLQKEQKDKNNELRSFVKEAYFCSFETDSKLLYLNDFVLKVEKFYRKNYQIYSHLVFKSILVFFFTLIASCFLKLFYPLFFQSKEFLTQQISFSLLLLVSLERFFAFLRTKVPVYFFYDRGLTLQAQRWLQAYFLEKVNSEEPYFLAYKKLEAKVFFSGLSLTKEKKLLLESWINEQDFLAREKQRKFFDYAIVFEVFINLFIFVFMMLPYFLKIKFFLL